MRTSNQEANQALPSAGTGAPHGAAAARSVPGDRNAFGAPLDSRVIDVLRTIRDPEIPLSIYELGLIYGLTVSPEGDIYIRMTLTTPACPVAGAMPGQVQAKVGALEGVRDVKVELVWDPPWSPEQMSDAAKLQLGLL